MQEENRRGVFWTSLTIEDLLAVYLRVVISDHNCPFSFEIALTETETFSAIRTFVALATIDVNRP
jgi:hypothetical protein